MTPSSALNAATASAILLQIAASFVPIPCVKSAADASLTVLRSIEGLSSNRELRDELIIRIYTIMNDVAEPLKGKLEEDLPDDVKISIEKFTKDLQSIQADLEVHLVSEKGSWFKIGTRIHGFLNYTQVTTDLKNCSSRLSWAAQKFQVEGILRVRLNADTHHNEMMREVREVRELVSTSANASAGPSPMNILMEPTANVRLRNLPSVVMPNQKDIFHGRDEYVEDAINTILQHLDGARLAVLGPGGMGKTAVLLAIAHDDRITARYGDSRYWIPCEQAASIELLLGLIANALKIKNLSNDPLQDIQMVLRKNQRPCIFLFDNFETPFHIDQKQAEVEDIIQMVASFPKVSILITMRGQARPCTTLRWTRPPLPSLIPLAIEPARKTFLDISPETAPSSSLDELLNLLDRVPLAVVIVASLAQLGERPEKLIERFQKDGSALLQQGDDRLHSINCSVRISITSPPMKSNSEALVLLQILSTLPGGVRTTRLLDIAPGLQNHDAALGALKRTSLVYVTPDDVVRVLSPISSYVIHNHLLLGSHRQSLYEYYYRLAARSNCVWTPDFVQIKTEMASEEANMDAVLLYALEHVHSREAIKACENYTWFLQGHIPRIDVILQAIKTAERLQYFDLVADCLFVRASIDYHRSNFEQATHGFGRARQLYVQHENQKQEAHCLRRLGDIHRMKSEDKEARTYLEEAKNKFEAINDTLGTAQCLQSLGDILLGEGSYEDARSHLEKAKIKFKEISSTHGTAHCLMRLCETLRMEYRDQEARTHLEEARDKFEEISDTLGIAQCLQSLGDILFTERRYEEARMRLEEAKRKLEEIGNTLGTAQCLQSLSDILLAENRFDEAKAYLEEARAKFEETSDTRGTALCLWSLGEFFAMGGSFAEAQALFHQALSGYESVGDENGAENCRKSIRVCQENEARQT